MAAPHQTDDGLRPIPSPAETSSVETYFPTPPPSPRTVPGVLDTGWRSASFGDAPAVGLEASAAAAVTDPPLSLAPAAAPPGAPPITAAVPPVAPPVTPAPSRPAGSRWRPTTPENPIIYPVVDRSSLTPLAVTDPEQFFRNLRAVATIDDRAKATQGLPDDVAEDVLLNLLRQTYVVPRSMRDAPTRLPYFVNEDDVKNLKVDSFKEIIVLPRAVWIKGDRSGRLHRDRRQAVPLYVPEEPSARRKTSNAIPKKLYYYCYII